MDRLTPFRTEQVFWTAPGRDARHRSPAAPCAPDPGSARAVEPVLAALRLAGLVPLSDLKPARGRLPPGHPAGEAALRTLVRWASHRRLRMGRVAVVLAATGDRGCPLSILTGRIASSSIA